MNIAFDIDGVFTNLEKYMLEVGGEYFKEKFNMDIVNPKGNGIKEIFECTDEQEYQFWRDNIIEYSSKYPMRVGCKETIKKIKEDGNKIFIITSRIKADEKSLVGALMRTYVKKFLKDIPYEAIEFCSVKNSPQDKREACLKHNIDLIVEDTPANIDELQKVTKVVCFDAAYNREIDESIPRITSFNELFCIINKLNPNKEMRILPREDREKLEGKELEEYYKKLQEYYKKRTNVAKYKKQARVYNLIYGLGKKLFNMKYPYELINAENIPEETGVIYIANHRDMIDPPLVMSAIGKKPVHLLLKSDFGEKFYTPLLSSLGCFYVTRDNRDSQILTKEEMMKIILAGHDVIIFPEGTRNKTDKELLEFQKGAVSVARATGRPIVPLGISKKFDDFQEKIVVNVGEPMYIDYQDDLAVKNEELEDNVKLLLTENKSRINVRSN